MTEPTVTTRGSARRQVPPTSVLLRGDLVATGNDRQGSLDALVAAQRRITESFGEAVTFTRVTSRDTQDGRDRRVHRHAATFELVVDDVERAGADVTRLVELGAEVHGAEWRIQDDATVHTEVRGAAVEDAVARARDYASALGMALGELVSVTDGAGRGEPVPRPFAAARSGGGELSLAPRPVDVTASAEVRFLLVQR